MIASRREQIADGDHDQTPEQAFFMCGGLDEVERKSAMLEKETEEDSR